MVWRPGTAGDDDGKVSKVFDATLARDLKLSGYFHVIDPKAYIENPQTSGYDIGQFNFSDWSSSNSEFLIKGAVRRDANNISIAVLLFGVGQHRRAAAHHDAVGGDIQRRLADIVEQLLRGEQVGAAAAGPLPCLYSMPGGGYVIGNHTMVEASFHVLCPTLVFSVALVVVALAVFNAIFFKNLLQLYAIHADGQYLSAMRAYSATLWQSVDPRTGLLELQPSQPVPLLNQAGLVQLYALLAWNPGQYSNLA